MSAGVERTGGIRQVPDRNSALIKREPLLAEKLADQIRQEIASGTFKAGQKLPTEREMSEAHGVSRAIVREALGRLKHDGLVVSRQGSGVFVAEGTAPTLRLYVVPSDAEDLRAVVELLSAVRSAASAYAAERRTPAQLATITHWYEAIGHAIRDSLSGEEEDIAFHRAIMDAAGNPLFNQVLEFLDARVREFVRTARTNSRHRGLSERVQEEHRVMRDAIAAGDPEAARRAAEQHLANALKRLALADTRRPLRPKRRTGVGRQDHDTGPHRT
jgi:GntR family transcriptional repressor for pyruvate dehydrogenase complex